MLERKIFWALQKCGQRCKNCVTFQQFFQYWSKYYQIESDSVYFCVFGRVHNHTDAHIKQDVDTLAVSSQASWANMLQVIRKSLLTSEAQRRLITKTWNSNVTQQWDSWSFCRHWMWHFPDGWMHTKRLPMAIMMMIPCFSLQNYKNSCQWAMTALEDIFLLWYLQHE